jgi:hypothetical protein
LQNLQRTNEKQNEKISEYEKQILENGGRILLGKRKDAKYQYKLKKSDNLKNRYRLLHDIFHIILFISPRSLLQPDSPL